MPAIGLDISDSAVTALELVRRKGSFAVGRYGRRALPQGSILGGYVHDQAAVVAELCKLRDELALDFVNASLSEEKAYLFKANIPRVKRKEMREVIEFKLEENVPIPASDAIFDYTLISEAGHEAPDHLDVGVTVLPKKVVETYAELLAAADLMPLSFETEAQAIARALVARGDRGTYLIVNFGESKTGLFIVSEEVVHFTSTVAIGGAHITEAIGKSLSISKEEAKALKTNHEAFKDRKGTELFPSLLNTLSVLKDEVSKLSIYWRTHKDPAGELGKKIQRILLCGRDSSLVGFADYLSLALQTPAHVGNVWCNAFSFEEYIPPLSRDESLDYAAAIGLAMSKGH